MALKVTDLKIDPTSLGKSFLLADITPSYEYKNGEKTERINGYRYSVALPDLRFEKIAVKIPIEKRNTALFDVVNGNAESIPSGVKLNFKGLEVKTYHSNGNLNVTASADDVFIVKE